MIRVQMWKGDRLVFQRDHSSERAVREEFDRSIEAVHAGRFQDGVFTVTAHRINHFGAFMGHYWTVEEVAYPLKQVCS